MQVQIASNLINDSINNFVTIFVVYKIQEPSNDRTIVGYFKL